MDEEVGGEDEIVALGAERVRLFYLLGFHCVILVLQYIIVRLQFL